MQRKKIIQMFFSATAITSIALLVIVVACWVRSYHVRDTFHFGVADGHAHTLQSILGRVHVISDLSGQRESGETMHSSDRLVEDANWNGSMSGYPVKVQWHCGCVFQRYSEYHMPFSADGTGFTSQHQLVVIPYWWLALLFAILPVIKVVHNNLLNRTSEPAPLDGTDSLDG
jgi:hypothetical protein